MSLRLKTIPMTCFFLRVIVWLTYPLMALMVGALVVGGQSESRLIAYEWITEWEAATLNIYLTDLTHQLTIPIVDGVSYLDPIEWLDEDSLFYYRTDLSRPIINGSRSYFYEIYDLTGEPRPVDYLNSIHATNVGYSPDGHYVAYVYEDSVYISNLESMQQIVVTNAPEMRWSVMEWSPDNCRIAFAEALRYVDTTAKLWTYDVCNQTRSLIAEDFKFYWFSRINWSYSGNYLSFSTQTDGISTMIVIDMETKIPILSEINTYDYTKASWSPTLNQFTFSAREDSSQPSNIYIVDVDSGIITQITDPTSDDFAPQWSPDGMQIAFVSNLNQQPDARQLFIMDADGSNVRQISDVAGYVVGAQWQPLP